jgi:hypothetical protein
MLRAIQAISKTLPQLIVRVRQGSIRQTGAKMPEPALNEILDRNPAKRAHLALV